MKGFVKIFLHVVNIILCVVYVLACIFKSHINDELDEYFARFVESYMPRNVNPQQEYEDIPFFYPIAGAIRFNLIARIK